MSHAAHEASPHSRFIGAGLSGFAWTGFAWAAQARHREMLGVQPGAAQRIVREAFADGNACA
jgi:hypothetical protein